MVPGQRSTLQDAICIGQFDGRRIVVSMTAFGTARHFPAARSRFYEMHLLASFQIILGEMKAQRKHLIPTTPST
jgi:hypothetical protein